MTNSSLSYANLPRRVGLLPSWSDRELTLAANWIYPHTQWSSDHQMVNISTPMWWSIIFGGISESFIYFCWHQSEILAGLIKLVPPNQDVWQIVLNSLFIQLLVSFSKLNIIEQKLIKPLLSNISCLNQFKSQVILQSTTERNRNVIKVGQFLFDYKFLMVCLAN